MVRFAFAILMVFSAMNIAIAQNTNAQQGQLTTEEAKQKAAEVQAEREALREKMKAEKEALQQERKNQIDKLKTKSTKKDDNGDN